MTSLVLPAYNPGPAVDRTWFAVERFIAGRPDTPPTLLDDVRDRGRYWGWSIGTAYGEPFASREELGLKGVDCLL